MLAIALFTTSSDFNPRSYKRSDKKAGLSYTVSGISIHAPTRGATVDVPPEWFVPINFNPRSYKRSDGVFPAQDPVYLKFQSTLLQEERP